MLKKTYLLIHLSIAVAGISLTTPSLALSVRDLENSGTQPFSSVVTENAPGRSTVDKSPDSDRAEAYYLQGTLLQQQGKLDEAIAAYQTALRFNPHFAPVHLNLGAALAAQGKVGDAIAAYLVALGINPNLAEAHYNLGNALAQQGKLQEAIASYREAIELNPNYAKAYYNWGNLLAQQGNREEAIVRWQEAVRIRPDFAEAHVNLGLNLSRQGRQQEAMEAFKKARDLFKAQGKIQQVEQIERILQRVRGSTAA